MLASWMKGPLTAAPEPTPTPEQVARGSAWGLFVVGVPRAADSGRRYGPVAA